MTSAKMVVPPDLVLVPIPSLSAILLKAEKTKGAPLTQDEVLAIRDNVACIAMPHAAKEALNDKRGYVDIDLENAWQEWLELRKVLLSEGHL